MMRLGKAEYKVSSRDLEYARLYVLRNRCRRRYIPYRIPCKDDESILLSFLHLGSTKRFGARFSFTEIVSFLIFPSIFL